MKIFLSQQAMDKLRETSNRENIAMKDIVQRYLVPTINYMSHRMKSDKLMEDIRKYHLASQRGTIDNHSYLNPVSGNSSQGSIKKKHKHRRR